MAEPRTKQAALEGLLALLGRASEPLSDPIAVQVLSDDLVREIFAEAWQYQFEEDFATFDRAVRDLVNDAIAQRLT